MPTCSCIIKALQKYNTKCALGNLMERDETHRMGHTRWTVSTIGTPAVLKPAGIFLSDPSPIIGNACQ